VVWNLEQQNGHHMQKCLEFWNSWKQQEGDFSVEHQQWVSVPLLIVVFLSNSSWTTKTGDRAPWLNYGTWTEKLRIDELI
jgi:hypothetical protein